MVHLAAPTPDNRALLDCLAQLYTHDFSEVVGIKPDADGELPSQSFTY